MRKMKHIALAIALTASLSISAQQLETVTINGTNRTMMVYAPEGLPENPPLMISLHGANQDAAYQRDQTKWNNCADTAKIVVLYPNAINKFWDVNGQSDINFISALIDLMHDRYQVDLNRVYVSGFSLGAMMTYHCMEYLGDKIAAFGPVSGVRFDNKEPNAPRRVPFIHTHGTGDDVFKWVGDPGHMAGGYPYIPDYVEKWATYEGLTEKEVISPYPESKQNSIATLTTWRSPDPDDDIEIALLALKDKGHWHSEDLASGVSTTQEIWKFCKRYTLQPEPPTLISAEPEDKSFDLPTTLTTYSLTFSNLADVSCINATLTGEDTEIALTCQETQNSNTVNFNVPDTEILVEGKYLLTVAGIKNPEGGDEKTVTVSYTYGPSEEGERIKEEFRQMYERAIELYNATEEASQMSVVNARNRLKKYIDKYADFASTAPSAYEKAMENLSKNMTILEEYLESVGISDISVDLINGDCKYYTIYGQQIPQPQKGISISVRHDKTHGPIITKIYR